MMDLLHTATTFIICRWWVASTVISMLLLLLISSSDAFISVQQHQHHPSSSLCIMSSSSTHQSTNHATLIQGFDRPTAQQVVTTTLCPPNEERSRNNAGMEAFGDDRHSKVITNDDPRNEYTYGEFPFGSFDLLVDRAIEYVDDNDQQQHEEDGRNRNMLDLGSGCGRLVLYAGLTRGGWDVTGIEIGKQLHSLAVNSLQRGINGDLLKPVAITDDASTANSKISFYNGNALRGEDPYFQDTESDDETIQSILSEANLLFAYSTVWETDSSQSFNPELQAMVLSSKWSKSLAAVCQDGVVAVTTDRVLNPDDGWKLLDRMDVDNPSVWGSVGYISVLQK
ncbi:hypothetical protein ACHAWC_005067 [Mediolabrus comicus]